MDYQHTPVMLKEVLEILDPRPGQNFIDGTLGGAGYSQAIAERIKPGGKILSLDLDETAISHAEEIIKKKKIDNIILAHDNFKNLEEIVKENFSSAPSFSGIVFDLGLSSAQLQSRDRGFSFAVVQSPLSMNFGQTGLSAEEIVNKWSEDELTKIFRDYGEEKFSLRIARAIVDRRRTEEIKKVGQLVKIILDAIPKRLQSKSKIHPATKVFQALRIAVNDELNSLSKVLPQAINLLGPGGKIVVISYHSLEDRIVKQYFRQEAKDCLCPPAMPVCQCGHKARLKLLFRKAMVPTEAEVEINPRSRSAKLRAIEKI